MATNSVDDLAQGSMAYFPHDSNAASDIKCQRLIMRRGYDGYGRWWRMCEHLASIKGHAVPFETHEDKLILGMVLGLNGGGSYDEYITIEETESFIGELLSIGLLTTNQNGELENSRMHENAKYFGKKRAAGKKGGRPKKTATVSKTAGE